MATRSIRSRQRAADATLDEESQAGDGTEKRFLPERDFVVPVEPAEAVEESKPKRRTRANTNAKSSQALQAVSRPETPENDAPEAAPETKRTLITTPAEGIEAKRNGLLSTPAEGVEVALSAEVAEAEPRRAEDEGASLKDIKREILEARNLVIKADNQVKSLSGELKTITKFLEGERTRRTISSASAYVLFALISFGGLYLFFNSRLGDLEKKIQEVEAQKQLLESEAKKRLGDEGLTRGAEEAALGVLRGLRGGDRAKALREYQNLDFAHLTPLEAEILRIEVERQRETMAREHFDQGEELYRSKQYKRAEEEFNASLELKKDSSKAPDALYYLGMIHHSLGRYQDAIEELEHARDDAPKASWQAEAQYYIALSYEQFKQLARARVEYQAYLRRYPNGIYAQIARKKLED
jgi:TolA-binding protein